MSLTNFKVREPLDLYQSGSNAFTTFSFNNTTSTINVSATSFTINGNQVWHEGNDGIGSGLDADTLQGNTPSYFTNASNLSSGTIPVARLPALSGDVVMTAGTGVLSLGTTGVVPGTYSNVVVDDKGRITGGNNTLDTTTTKTIISNSLIETLIFG